jgi:hypothetical protein
MSRELLARQMVFLQATGHSPEREIVNFGVTQRQLNCPEVFGTALNQGRLGPSHGMCSILGWIQTNFLDPTIQNSGVLSCAKVW